MADSKELRWRRRFENFRKALGRLEEACELDEYSDLELAGLVQTFEMTFELGWKVLRDLLSSEGIVANTPREAIRLSFEAGYTDEKDVTILLDVLDKRNLLSHTYDEGTAKEAEILIKENYAPTLVVLFKRLSEKC